MKKKLVAKAVEKMMAEIPNKRFLDTIAEPNPSNAVNGVFAYLIGDKGSNTATHLVAWRAVNLDNSMGSTAYPQPDNIAENINLT